MHSMGRTVQTGRVRAGQQVLSLLGVYVLAGCSSCALAARGAPEQN